MWTEMGCMTKVDLSIVASMTGLVMEQRPCNYGQRFVFSLLPTCLNEAASCAFSPTVQAPGYYSSNHGQDLTVHDKIHPSPAFHFPPGLVTSTPPT